VEVDQLIRQIQADVVRQSRIDLALIVTGLAIFLVVCSILGSVVGNLRGRAGLGALLGLCLGPIGVLVAVLLPPISHGPTVKLGADRPRFRQEAAAEGWLDSLPSGQPKA
jgi:hypothetical protein